MTDFFNLNEFIQFTAADLIPQLLKEVKDRAESLHNDLSHPGVMTRPPKRIDPIAFLYFVLNGHQIKKIASYFNTTPQTLYNKFGDIIATCQLIADDDVLRALKKKVDEGDTRVLVHLSKTRLGNAETINVNPNGVDEFGEAKPRTFTWIPLIQDNPEVLALKAQLDQKVHDQLEAEKNKNVAAA